MKQQKKSNTIFYNAGCCCTPHSPCTDPATSTDRGSTGQFKSIEQPSSLAADERGPPASSNNAVSNTLVLYNTVFAVAYLKVPE